MAKQTLPGLAEEQLAVAQTEPGAAFAQTEPAPLSPLSPAVDPLAATRRAEALSIPTEPPTGGSYPVVNWDRYEFLRLLGHGGMGEVYKARDRRLRRIVALKFIRGSDERMTQRFMQEARAQARIDHPHVCKVFEVGEIASKSYIAMQFVDGPSLEQAKPLLSLLDKVGLVKQVAEALHCAHELGIIHRELMPRRETRRFFSLESISLSKPGKRDAKPLANSSPVD